MTEQNTNPPATSPTAARRLLTREQVLSALRQEVQSGGQGGLTATAHRYGLSAQQLNDILVGRSNLSKRVVAKLRLRLHQFYEKLED